MPSARPRIASGFVPAAALVAAIVAISAFLASAEAAPCSAKAAREAGLSGYVPKDEPKPVPETPFYDLDGNEHTIADWRGRGVVLNFWATWCAPCVEEMPALDALNARLADDAIDVVTIDGDRDGAKVVPEFFEKNGIETLPALIDRGMAFVRAAEVQGLPTTLLVDADGAEVGAVLGAAEWDDPAIVDFVRQCLAPGDGMAGGG